MPLRLRQYTIQMQLHAYRKNDAVRDPAECLLIDTFDQSDTSDHVNWRNWYQDQRNHQVRFVKLTGQSERKGQAQRYTAFEPHSAEMHEQVVLYLKTALFRGVYWWAMTGSNRRPSRCKRDALPTELIARYPVSVSIGWNVYRCL